MCQVSLRMPCSLDSISRTDWLLFTALYQSPIMDEGRNMCLIFPGLIHGMHEGELKHNGKI